SWPSCRPRRRARGSSSSRKPAIGGRSSAGSKRAASGCSCRSRVFWARATGSGRIASKPIYQQEQNMRVSVEAGAITAKKADAIVVNLFEGVPHPGGDTGAVDQALGGMLSDLIAAGDLRGKWGEFTLLHTGGKIAAPRVVVAGLGKQDKFDIDRVRDLAGNL